MDKNLGILIFNIKTKDDKIRRYYLNSKNVIVEFSDFNLINSDTEYRTQLFKYLKKVTNRSFKIRHTKFVKTAFDDITTLEAGTTWITEKDYFEDKFIN